MSTRRSLWICLLILAAYLLQTALIAPLSWPFAGPDLFLLVVLAWASSLPRFDAALVGFFSGLLLDLAPPIDGPLGKWALVLMICSILISSLRGGDESPLARTGVLGLGSTGVVLAGFLFSSVVGEGVRTDSLLVTVIGVGVWNVVFAPPVLMVVRKIVRGTVKVDVIR